MSTHTVWDGAGATRYVRARAIRWLHTVGWLLVTKAKELLSVPGTGRLGGRPHGPVVRSRPGEPPRKQTGRGRGSVAYEVDEQTMTMRAGTNVDYMRHQELGTRRGLLPRPWLRPAFYWVLQHLPRP